MQAATLIRHLWTIAIVYWLIRGFGNKKPKSTQGWKCRALYSVVLVGTIAFLASRKNLAHRVLPMNAETRFLGVILCAAGLALAVWARYILGRNWSGRVMIKQDHELIRRGPYKIVRHPIYTGLIVALAGTALALYPTARGVLLVLVWFVTFYLKSRLEERVLTREFGDQYASYKRGVKAALIPFVL
jgi:protein-S-isoprenylcysteine O-methyltransferase Ste14